MLLGDRIAKALAATGISQEAVSKWLGAPCNCAERQAKLNALDAWSRRVIGGQLLNAIQYLREITGAK